MPISTELLKLDSSAIIDLYELDLSPLGVSTVYRFTPETIPSATVSYKGKVYDAIPITIDGFEFGLKAPFPRPTMQVSNVFGTISSLIIIYQDLCGAKVTRRRTLVKYLDGQAESGGEELTPEIYFVERKTAENELYVAFELISGLEMESLRLPARKITRRCMWIYRGPDCGFTAPHYYDQYDQVVSTAAQDKCGKRLSSCKRRFGPNAELPFGGFPGVDIPGAY